MQVFHSLSDDRLVTISSSFTRAVVYLKTAALGCVADNVIVEVFYNVGKILLSEISHHFYSNTLQYFNLVGLFMKCITQ